MWLRPVPIRFWLLLAPVVLVGCGGTSLTDSQSKVPASLDIVSGQSQSGVVGTQLNDPLGVTIRNSAGNPIAGQLVNFRIISGGGSVFAGAALTGSDGVAKERWTLGTSIADSQVVEARAVDATTGDALVFGRFQAKALAGPVTTIDKVSGDGQAGRLGSPLTSPLLVRARDQYSNVVAGAALTWS